ncbi:MAG: sensor histidine kinase, partial [Promethearchaeota archaeon]
NKSKPEIKIILSRIVNEVEIKIIDNGIGIEESNLPKVFDPFYTTKKVGEGTGLGLPTCRGIIEKHGGKISIKSKFEKGTEVVITLPLNYSN